MNDLPDYIKVYVGVDDLSAQFKDETKKFLLDYIISHKDGYKGSVLFSTSMRTQCCPGLF